MIKKKTILPASFRIVTKNLILRNMNEQISICFAFCGRIETAVVSLWLFPCMMMSAFLNESMSIHYRKKRY